MLSARGEEVDRIVGLEVGADDYLPKPFDLPDLMKRSAKALDQKRQAPKVVLPAREAGDDLPLVGRTPAMQTLYRLVARVMNTELPVLITGKNTNPANFHPPCESNKQSRPLRAGKECAMQCPAPAPPERRRIRHRPMA